jgi:hypothetical protein
MMRYFIASCGTRRDGELAARLVGSLQGGGASDPRVNVVLGGGDWTAGVCWVRPALPSSASVGCKRDGICG